MYQRFMGSDIFFFWFLFIFKDIVSKYQWLKCFINLNFFNFILLQLFEDIVDILDPEMNLDPDEDFSDQLEEEEEEDDFKEEGQGSPKDKDEDVVKSEGGQSQG